MTQKIRVGILGNGRAGSFMHVPEMKNYPEYFEIIAGCDPAADRNEEFAKLVPGAKIYQKMEDLLADTEVELVTVATRSTQHVAHSIAALEAGKYVFHEKPIALNCAELQRLIDADKKYPGKLFLRHNRRFEPAFNHIMEIIASGILGDIYEIRLNRHSYQWRQDWQTRIDCGGGMLNNWGPHMIDQSLRLLGAPLSDFWSNIKNVASLGDAEDSFKVLFKGTNGRIVDLDVSAGAALAGPVYTVLGARGALVCEKEETIKLKYVDPAQATPPFSADPGNPPLHSGFKGAVDPVWVEKEIPVDPAAKCQMHSIWVHLYRAIREGVTYPITLAQGAETVRVTEMIKSRSAYAYKF